MTKRHINEMAGTSQHGIAKSAYNAGFVISDPCYVLEADIYDIQWGDMMDFKTGTVEIGKSSFGVIPTPEFDGKGTTGEFYTVDSGTFAVIPAELIPDKTLKDLKVYPGSIAEIEIIDDSIAVYVNDKLVESIFIGEKEEEEEDVRGEDPYPYYDDDDGELEESVKLTARDKSILESLEAQYGVEAVTTAILNGGFQNVSTTIMNPNEPQCDLKTKILDYIREIEGYRIRLREIHWSAECMAIHKLADDMMNELIGFEDEIAEEMMGITKQRIKIGELYPTMPEETSFEDLLKKMTDDTLCIKTELETCKECIGICSILDDVIHSLGKTKYLETFT